MSKPSFVYALVEDSRQRQLIYRFLTRAGFRPDQMEIQFSPAARGSAEKWVCDNIAMQAAKCRERTARGNSTGMFVMLDADKRSVQERLEALDEALVRNGKNRISSDSDPIARLIPKRNVETWLLYLSSGGVVEPPANEEQDYKGTKTPDEWSKLVPRAAERLYSWTKSGASLPTELPDSLRRGLAEILRALPAKV